MGFGLAAALLELELANTPVRAGHSDAELAAFAKTICDAHSVPVATVSVDLLRYA